MIDPFDGNEEAGNCAAARYLRRVPENLVVNGYRGWLLFALEDNQAHLHAVLEALCRSLGERAAASAMAGLDGLIRQLGKCAVCPLRFKRPNTSHLCRDECLLLSMIAGLQHGDEEAAFEGAAALTYRARAAQVLGAGAAFAIELKLAGQQLLPIHADTVRWIVSQNTQASEPTIH